MVVILFITFLILQGVIISYSPLNLAGDEAYYWLWSKHLDLCYFEKGPGIGLLIALGTKFFGDSVLGVRSAALFCQFLILSTLYFFLLKNYSKKIATITTLSYLSTLLFGTLGLFMTCDPPLCLFWLLSLQSAYNAIKNNDPKYWTPALTFIGFAALFKYTAVILLPSYVLFLILNPKFRSHLRHPGFLLGTVLIAALLSPVIIWNSQHDWINFGKAYGHMGNHKRNLGVGHFFELIFGQWGLMGPILFPVLLYVYFTSYKEWRLGDKISGLLIFSSLPLATLCLLVSFQRSVYANWPMPIYLNAIMLLGHFLNKRPDFKIKLISRSLFLNFSVIILAHLLFTGKTFGLPAKILPTVKLITGSDLGKAVDERMSLENFNSCSKMESTSETSPFILTERYKEASLIAFYSSHRDDVFLATLLEPKLSQFDIWQKWEDLKGKNALIVIANKKELEALSPLFSKISDAGEIERSYNGQLIGKTYFFIACNFNGANISNIVAAPPTK